MKMLKVANVKVSCLQQKQQLNVYNQNHDKMTKATVDIFLLIGVVALTIMILIPIILLTTKGLDEGCKISQIDKLNEVLRQLDNFEKMNQTIQIGSYNTIENFEVKKSCTSEIKYDESGFLEIKWSDGSIEKIPTNAKWKLGGEPLVLTEGTTYDMRVSLRSVIATPSQHSL